jgi:ribosomal protein S12 methylthiotransferase accessory factor
MRRRDLDPRLRGTLAGLAGASLPYQSVARMAEGGLVSSPIALTSSIVASPRLYTCSASVGQVSALRSPSTTATGNFVSASGRAGHEVWAMYVALFEACERYASYLPGDLTVATAEQLGVDALRLGTIPHCSEEEYAHPRCPLERPDPALEMRWVKGLDLCSCRELWVPASMVFLQTGPEPGSRPVSLSISTGCAVHFNLEVAVLRGLYEVIERDAIALTWLQRLPLPHLDDSVLDDSVTEWIELSRRQFIRTLMYDATTDVGVPVVYCLQLADYSAQAAQVVGCACGLDVTEAARHALVEAITVRQSIAGWTDLPDDFEAFTRVMDGAAFMGSPARRDAFDFLTGADRATSIPAAFTPESHVPPLEAMLGRLRALGMHLIVVNITTAELWRAGLVAVRVIVPEMQPLSLRPLWQYRGHPRLYQAPRQMGLPSCVERDLNQWPQPFA